MLNTLSIGVMKTYNASAAELGRLSACYFWGEMVFLFPAGLLLDRFSTRKLVLITLSISIMATFTFAIAPSLAIAAMARFVSGVTGGSFCFLSSMRLISRWFPASKRALATGIVVTIGMLGGVVAQTPLALLTEAIGWQHALLILGSLGLLILIAGYLFIKDAPLSYTYIKHERLIGIGFWQSIRLAVLNVQNWLGCCYTCLLNLPILLLGALWGNLYLTQVNGISNLAASRITMMLYIGTIIGSPIIGRLSDNLGLRRPPMLVGAILSLILILIIMYLPQPSIFTLSLLFLGVGLFSSSQTLGYPFIAESNPMAVTASVTGLATVIIMSGGAVFQPLFGWLMNLQWNGSTVNHMPIYSVASYDSALLVLPIATILSLVCAILAKETYVTIKKC